MLEVGARLNYGPRALLQIGLHLRRGRIWGLFQRDIAHDHLKLRMTFHTLIDCLSKASVLVVRSAVMAVSSRAAGRNAARGYNGALRRRFRPALAGPGQRPVGSEPMVGGFFGIVLLK